jgi:hypothetical protein
VAVVLVDQRRAVEAEIVRVGAQKPARVRVAREHTPGLGLEGVQVADANPDRLFRFLQVDPGREPGLTQRFADPGIHVHILQDRWAPARSGLRTSREIGS